MGYIQFEAKLQLLDLYQIIYYFIAGGRGGIRTRDRVTPMPPFQGGAFNRSTTLPRAANYSAYWYKTQHPNVNFALWFF